MNIDAHRFKNIVCVVGLTMGLALGQSFEVASVRLGRPPAQSTMGPLPGGERFMARNMPLVWLLSAAYSVPMSQISGLSPDNEGYDIEAKAEHPVNREQMMLLLRSLLEDRFKLVVRRETKQLTARVLVVAKGGAKMDENRDGAELAMRKITGNKMSYHNITMPQFVNILAFDEEVGDTVVDGTGLTGSYDFTLDYYRGPGGPGVLEGREPAPDPNGPSLHEALEKQLGLKLESRKGPVKLLVVEHIERPPGN
jgi:uncharacterized protein (TIGR03435 family)